MKGISAVFCTLAVLATSVAAIPSDNAPRFPYQGMEASAVGQKRSMISEPLAVPEQLAEKEADH